jgi:hypothetical protein
MFSLTSNCEDLSRGAVRQDVGAAIYVSNDVIIYLSNDKSLLSNS